ENQNRNSKAASCSGGVISVRFMWCCPWIATGNIAGEIGAPPKKAGSGYLFRAHRKTNRVGAPMGASLWLGSSIREGRARAHGRSYGGMPTPARRRRRLESNPAFHQLRRRLILADPVAAGGLGPVHRAVGVVVQRVVACTPGAVELG